MSTRHGIIRDAIVLFLGLAFLKLLAIWLMGAHQHWPDSLGYWQLGEAVAQGDWLLLNPPVGVRTPGYPWIIGLHQRLFGSHALFVLTGLQLGLHFLTLLLCCLICRDLSRSEAAAAVCALLGLISSARAFYDATVLTESWSTFLSLLIVYLILRYIRVQSWKYLVIASLLLGISVLIRPAGIALLPVLLLAGLAPGLKQETYRLKEIFSQAAIRNLILIMGIVSAIVMPWCLRNQLIFGQFTICTMTGCELWTVTFSDWTGAGYELPDTAESSELQRIIQADDAEVDIHWNQQIRGALQRTGMDDGQADQMMKTVSLQAISEKPINWLSYVGVRCLSFWYVKDWPWVFEAAPAQGKQLFVEDQNFIEVPFCRKGMQLLSRYCPEMSFPFVWMMTVLTFLSLGLLLFQRSHRYQALILFLAVALPTFLTALLEIPCYRYRMVTEPFSLIVISVALNLLFTAQRSE